MKELLEKLKATGKLTALSSKESLIAEATELGYTKEQVEAMLKEPSDAQTVTEVFEVLGIDAENLFSISKLANKAENGKIELNDEALASVSGGTGIGDIASQFVRPPMEQLISEPYSAALQAQINMILSLTPEQRQLEYEMFYRSIMDSLTQQHHFTFEEAHSIAKKELELLERLLYEPQIGVL